MEMSYEQMIAEATEIPRSKLSAHTHCEGCGIQIDMVYNHDGYFISPFNEQDKREYNVTQCLNCGRCNKWKVYRKKKLQEQDACRKCDGKIRLEASSRKGRHKKQYYYTHYFQCTKCKTIYMDDKYKVIN